MFEFIWLLNSMNDNYSLMGATIDKSNALKFKHLNSKVFAAY